MLSSKFNVPRIRERGREKGRIEQNFKCLKGSTNKIIKWISNFILFRFRMLCRLTKLFNLFKNVSPRRQFRDVRSRRRRPLSFKEDKPCLKRLRWLRLSLELAVPWVEFKQHALSILGNDASSSLFVRLFFKGIAFEPLRCHLNNCWIKTLFSAMSNVLKDSFLIWIFCQSNKKWHCYFLVSSNGT